MTGVTKESETLARKRPSMTSVVNPTFDLKSNRTFNNRSNGGQTTLTFYFVSLKAQGKQ